MTYSPQQPGQPPMISGPPHSPAGWRPPAGPAKKGLTPPVLLGLAVLGVFGAAAVVLVAVSFVVFTSKPRTSTPASAWETFAVAVTRCDGEPNSATAAIGFTVTNKSTTTRSATVRIEYHDASGDQLDTIYYPADADATVDEGVRQDTDISYVNDIPPGATVPAENSAYLAAPASSQVTCLISGVS